MIAELQLPTADLLVPLEGDVTTDHVEEEDPQGPHGGAVSMVLVEPDPLRRRVDSGPFNVPSMLDCFNYNAMPGLTIEISEELPLLFEKSSGPEVNELEFAGDEVHQDVLILDVPVDNSLAVASQHCRHYLTEEVSSNVFFQTFIVCDNVKQILAFIRSLEDEDEGIEFFKKLQELDHSLHSLELEEKFQLQGKPATSRTRDPVSDPGSGNMFDGQLQTVAQTAPCVDSTKASPA